MRWRRQGEPVKEPVKQPKPSKQGSDPRELSKLSSASRVAFPCISRFCSVLIWHEPAHPQESHVHAARDGQALQGREERLGLG